MSVNSKDLTGLIDNATVNESPFNHRNVAFPTPLKLLIHPNRKSNKYQMEDTVLEEPSEEDEYLEDSFCVTDATELPENSNSDEEVEVHKTPKIPRKKKSRLIRPPDSQEPDTPQKEDIVKKSCPSCEIGIFENQIIVCDICGYDIQGMKILKVFRRSFFS